VRRYNELKSLRLKGEQLRRISELVNSGRFESLSHVVREALKEYLNKQGNLVNGDFRFFLDAKSYPSVEWKPNFRHNWRFRLNVIQIRLSDEEYERLFPNAKRLPHGFNKFSEFDREAT